MLDVNATKTESTRVRLTADDKIRLNTLMLLSGNENTSAVIREAIKIAHKVVCLEVVSNQAEGA